MKKSQKYNTYHKSTSVQGSVIRKDNFTYINVLEPLSKYLKSTPIQSGSKKTVLDIGCGAGSLSFYAAEKGNIVYGIDVSPDAIKTCKESAKLLSLKKVFFKTMDFPKDAPSKQFDFIIFSEVLEHIKEEKVALNRVYSILAKNGILLITVPSSNAPLYRLRLLGNFDKRVGHVRRYNQKELVEKLEQHKFRILDKYKKEGILRNLLFTNDFFGKLVRVFNKFGFLAQIFTIVDNIMAKVFGESQILIIAKKNSLSS